MGWSRAAPRAWLLVRGSWLRAVRRCVGGTVAGGSYEGRKRGAWGRGNFAPIPRPHGRACGETDVLSYRSIKASPRHFFFLSVTYETWTGDCGGRPGKRSTVRKCWRRSGSVARRFFEREWRRTGTGLHEKPISSDSRCLRTGLHAKPLSSDSRCSRTGLHKTRFFGTPVRQDRASPYSNWRLNSSKVSRRVAFSARSSATSFSNASIRPCRDARGAAATGASTPATTVSSGSPVSNCT